MRRWLPFMAFATTAGMTALATATDTAFTIIGGDLTGAVG